MAIRVLDQYSAVLIESVKAVDAICERIALQREQNKNAYIKQLEERNAELEAENKRLKGELAQKNSVKQSTMTEIYEIERDIEMVDCVIDRWFEDFETRRGTTEDDILRNDLTSSLDEGIESDDESEEEDEENLYVRYNISINEIAEDVRRSEEHLSRADEKLSKTIDSLNRDDEERAIRFTELGIPIMTLDEMREYVNRRQRLQLYEEFKSHVPCVDVEAFCMDLETCMLDANTKMIQIMMRFRDKMYEEKRKQYVARMTDQDIEIQHLKSELARREKGENKMLRDIG